MAGTSAGAKKGWASRGKSGKSSKKMPNGMKQVFNAQARKKRSEANFQRTLGKNSSQAKLMASITKNQMNKAIKTVTKMKG